VLSDREQARLDEIQDQLLTEDPRFARTLEAPLRRPQSNSPDETVLRFAGRVLSWSTLVLALLLLMAGSLGGAALLAMLSVALWMARR